MLAKQFTLSPGLAESILTGIDTLLREKIGGIRRGESLHSWKVSEECKLAVRYILGSINEHALFTSLSQLAATVLSRLYEQERKKLAVPKAVRFCIIGLGKLGGNEMNFGADLDVVFLFEAKRKQDAEKCERLAANIISECSRTASSAKLYDVDARLRPEGRNAPLAVARGQYIEYLQKRASLWELQSLTRARVISGDKNFSAEIMESIRQAVYRSPLPVGWAEEIFSMRRKTESRSRTSASEFLDIKLGAGGIMDAEFAVQALQLSRGKDAYPSTNTYELLEKYSHNSAGSKEIAMIDQHYRMLRRVETALRLGLDIRTHIVPADEESLGYLTRLLKYPTSMELLSSLRLSMKETRTMFELLLRSLA